MEKLSNQISFYKPIIGQQNTHVVRPGKEILYEEQWLKIYPRVDGNQAIPYFFNFS